MPSNFVTKLLQIKIKHNLKLKENMKIKLKKKLKKLITIQNNQLE